MEFLPPSMQAVLMRRCRSSDAPYRKEKKKTKTKTKKMKRANPADPPSDGRCLWHKLPQEVKDFIFELTYTNEGLVRPIHKSSWQPRLCDCRHESRNTDNGCTIYDIKNHSAETVWNPVVPMEFLMIDREWYNAASKVFYRGTNFFLRHNYDYEDFPHSDNQQIKEFIWENDTPRPYAQFITTVTISVECITTATVVLNLVRHCPSMKRLHLWICPDYFFGEANDTELPDPRDTVWSELDFEKYDPTFFQLRGITDLRVEPAESIFEDIGGEIYLDNVHTFGNLIKPVASQPRPADWRIEELDEEEVGSEDESSPNAAVRAHTESPSQQLPKCPWNKLPQEIKDIIFEMAYVSAEPCKPRHKSNWFPLVCTCDHRIQCDALRYPRLQWSSICPLEGLMVNRQWYHAAAKVFYRRTNFFLEHPNEFDAYGDPLFIGEPMETFVHETSYAKFITTITFGLDDVSTTKAVLTVVKWCPLLTHVHLQIDREYFDDVDTPDICNRRWTKAEFEEYDATGLLKLRGISTLTIDEATEKWTEKAGKIFQDNLREFGEVIRAVACRPRPAHWPVLSPAIGYKTEALNKPPASFQETKEVRSNPHGNGEQCPWNKLPIELKEVILEMAYVPRREVCPLTKTMWEQHEIERRAREGEDYEVGWFPAKLIERFLINRQWYQAASDTFYKHSKFYFETAERMLDFVAHDGVPYVYAHKIKRVTVYLGGHDHDALLTNAVAHCASLRVLQLDIGACMFNEAHDEDLDCAFKTLWSERDFRQYGFTKALLDMKTDAKVQLTTTEGRKPLQNGANDRDFLSENLELLQGMLQKEPDQDHLPAKPVPIQSTLERPVRSCDITDYYPDFKYLYNERNEAFHNWALRQRG